MRRLLSVAILGVCATGCGRISFDSVGSVVDTAPLTYRDQVLADHPLGYWRIGDSGTVALDETGNGNGTYEGNCVHQVTGALTADANTATGFDYTDGCVVSLGDRFAFPGTTHFSLEAWMSIQRRSGGEYVFMKETRTPGTAENPLDGYGMIIDDGGIYAERVIGQDILYGDRVVLPARWTHVVYTYDGARAKVYLDGELASQVDDTRPMNAYSADVTVGGFSTVFAPADGFIDEIAIYDHALLPERVFVHHAVGVNGP